ncbi:HAD family hydrolase [Lentisphaerota bacterium WC36G]|nr:HAD family hydrolase [Lentisphaerae bacterium WC36]
MIKNSDYSIKAVVFDMDGTLTVPNIDFVVMRNELQIPMTGDIVEHVLAMDEERQKEAWGIINRIEAEAIADYQLQDYALEVLQSLQKNDIKLAILTRNTNRGIERFLKLVEGIVQFDYVLGREFPTIKPSPKPLWHILEKIDVAAENTLMVGDYIHDISCGNDAGAMSCFFFNADHQSYEEYADFTVRNFNELKNIVLR